jgi:hypothetical protein
MMRAELCGRCGAVLGYCPECDELAECGYCAAGLVPPRRRTAGLAIERRRNDGQRLRTPARPRRRQAERVDEAPVLQRLTGVTGDHLAFLGAAALAALARRQLGIASQVVDGQWREVDR